MLYDVLFICLMTSSKKKNLVDIIKKRKNLKNMILIIFYTLICFDGIRISKKIIKK